jgi:MFS superfamily sulfate permease-like transporter
MSHEASSGSGALRFDVVAGLVGAVVLPKAMAYGTVAGRELQSVDIVAAYWRGSTRCGANPSSTTR